MPVGTTRSRHMGYPGCCSSLRLRAADTATVREATHTGWVTAALHPSAPSCSRPEGSAGPGSSTGQEGTGPAALFPS